MFIVLLKKISQQKKYNDLVDVNDNYRKLMAENASAFKTQLPFFDVKPIYLLSAFIFYKIGVNLTYATVLPSIISYFLINVISFFWCKKFNLPFKALIAALLVISVINYSVSNKIQSRYTCMFVSINQFLFVFRNR